MLFIAACFICCGINLWLSYCLKPKLAGSFKVLASLCLVALAWTLDLFHNAPWFIIGLLFCLVGDTLLTMKGKGFTFLIGLVSFLIAHLFYSIAFIHLGTAIQQLFFVSVIIITLTTLVGRWLLEGLSPTHKRLVSGYLFVISTMVSLSLSLPPEIHGRFFLGFGACIFAISDVFVAINRFKKPNFINRLLGLPLYYLAQILLILGFNKML
mgnify:CR=1 FL=1